MKVGVVVFPGSNCDRDCADAVSLLLKSKATMLWHQLTELPQGLDLIILPGGFSYGDYLRSGALAHFAPIMQAVKAYANRGGLVLGICNGFQILTEARLLPGTLMRNRQLQFICDHVDIQVTQTETPFTRQYAPDQVIRLPIAHADGNYYAPPEQLHRLEGNGQVVFRYTNDVNGSVNQIAGIVNEKRNVLGMMPHPERNLQENSMFNADGRKVFVSILSAGLSQTLVG